MHVLAFRHVPFEDIGLIREALEKHGIGCVYPDLYASTAGVPDADAAAGLIFMGGPMSVNDDLPYLRQEEDLIRQAAAQGKPVLGVCLGAQLIARALGARVYRNHTREIGWFDVRLTPAAASDPMFGGLRPVETMFHWHGETFDLPEGAVLLAYSDACRNQAYRIGSNVYGLQFHPEVTPAIISDWCEQDANCGDVRELGEPIDSHVNAGRLGEISRILFGQWCRLVTASRSAGV